MLPKILLRKVFSVLLIGRMTTSLRGGERNLDVYRDLHSPFQPPGQNDCGRVFKELK
jgi:hypothetical protein